MQQTRTTSPEKKKEQEAVRLPEINIRGDAMLARVIGDLEKAGVPLQKDMETLAGNAPIINNTEVTAENRAAAISDLETMLESDLQAIKDARKQPEIARNEDGDPAYKQKMNALVQNLGEGIRELKKARLMFVSSYTKA